MKEYRALSGGRYTYSDDILNLQELALSMVQIFSGCQNFIISGCEVGGSSISEGYVFINGKVRKFEGATGVTSPYYICEYDSVENVTYAQDAVKKGREIFGAVGQSSPSSQCIKIENGKALRLDEGFVGRFALLLRNQKDQKVDGKVGFEELATKALSVSKEAQFVNSEDKLKVNIEDKCAFISFNKTSADKFASEIKFTESGEIELRSKGKTLFSISKAQLSVPVVKTEEIDAGLVISGNSIDNLESDEDDGAVVVNERSRRKGGGRYRSFIVKNGKGDVLFQVLGEEKKGEINVATTIASRTSQLTLKNSEEGGGDASYVAEVLFTDIDDKQMGSIGIKEDTFVLRSESGGVEIQPRNKSTKIVGELKVDDLKVGDADFKTLITKTTADRTYVRQERGKGLSANDFTAEYKKKLDELMEGVVEEGNEGYVTGATLALALKKKAPRLLGDYTVEEKQQVLENLGVLSNTHVIRDYVTKSAGMLDIIKGIRTTIDPTTGSNYTESAAQQKVREQIGAESKTSAERKYAAKSQKLADLIDKTSRDYGESDMRETCQNIGAAYAKDYQPKIKDTGWIEFTNRKMGTCKVRQIGNIVSICGKISGADGDIGELPECIDAPFADFVYFDGEADRGKDRNRGCRITVMKERKIHGEFSGWNEANVSIVYMTGKQ